MWNAVERLNIIFALFSVLASDHRSVHRKLDSIYALVNIPENGAAQNAPALLLLPLSLGVSVVE